MSRWRSLALAVVLSILVGGVSVGAHRQAPAARAAQIWAVQVGADVDLANGLTGNTYFPSAITIDAGDTMSWTFPSALAHTVTFDNGTVPPLAAAGLMPDPASGDLEITKIVNGFGAGSGNPAFSPTVQINSGCPWIRPTSECPSR
jgi:plastocyanin